MERPRGIIFLGVSFIAVAIFLIAWLNWYWVSEPADNLWHPMQLVLGHMFAVGVGGIGYGLMALKNSARWTAFLCLAMLVICGLFATAFDTLSSQGVWTVLDLMLLVLLIMPAAYLFLPTVDHAFAQARR